MHTGRDFPEVTRYVLYSHIPTMSLNIYKICGNSAVFSQKMTHDSFNSFNHTHTGTNS